MGFTLLSCAFSWGPLATTPVARAADAQHGDADHTDAGHAEGSHDGATHSASDPNPLAVDVDLAVWTGIVFLVLLAVLAQFAWGPIVAALEARERYVIDNIEAAEAKHEDAKQLFAEHQAQLEHAADEVRELLEEARRDAETTKAQIVAEAKRAADDERQRAIRDIDQAKDSAMKQLAEQSANVAVDLASSAIGDSLTPEIQSRMVRDALDKFAAAESTN